MKTLLANLGNRNIRFKNLFLTDYIRENNLRKTVFEFSKELYEDFAQQQKHLSITILNEIIKNKGEEINKIILFGSNQPERTWKDQDTIYFALIIQKILSSTLSGVETEVKELTCEITDNNQLLRTYKNFLNKRLEQNPQEQFIICDAGGTAQQKSSLKIMAEFLLREDQYEVHYVAYDGNTSIWKPIPQVEYRNVITSKQIIMLIALGEYNSALNLKTNFTIGQELKGSNFLLAFANFRIQMLVRDAASVIKRLPEKRSSAYSFLNDYKKEKPLSNNNSFQKVMSKHDHFVTAELLSIVQFFHAIKNYSQVVLFMSRFIEGYLNAFIKLKGFDLVNDYEKAFDKLIAFVQSDKDKLRIIRKHLSNLGVQDTSVLRKGVPLSIAFCLIYKEPKDHYKIINYFKILQKHNLSNLRNKLAHKGIGITLEKIKPLIPPINEIIEIYGLPEKNIYDEMNETIKKKL